MSNEKSASTGENGRASASLLGFVSSSAGGKGDCCGLRIVIVKGEHGDREGRTGGGLLSGARRRKFSQATKSSRSAVLSCCVFRPEAKTESCTVRIKNLCLPRKIEIVIVVEVIRRHDVALDGVSQLTERQSRDLAGLCGLCSPG